MTILAEIDLVGALVAGNVAQASALIYVFRRMERLVERLMAREDKLFVALTEDKGDK